MINKIITTNLIQEYKRPWKLFTLFIGISILIFGSFYSHLPDWDIPISIISALATYFTASWCMHVIIERQWKNFPLMLFFLWLSTDGCYWIYWHFQNPEVLVFFRELNFYVSLSLYAMCGIVWYYRGSVKQLISDYKEF